MATANARRKAAGLIRGCWIPEDVPEKANPDVHDPIHRKIRMNPVDRRLFRQINSGRLRESFGKQIGVSQDLSWRARAMMLSMTLLLASA